MKFTSELIESVGKQSIIQSHLPEQKTYDWVDVVGINQRPPNVQKNLFFGSHNDGKNEWYNPFDRRDIVSRVAREKGWDVVVDDPLCAVDTKDKVVVNSIENLSALLYEYSKANVDPYIIGVTGSVGKTTTIAFVEHLIQTAGIEVVRFWSKRLTPLAVQCHYINLVTPGTKFVVMEYSAYGHSHVGDLAKLLPPNLAVLLNIYDTHINPGMFTDQLDILTSKVRIKAPQTKAFINAAVLSQLGQDAIPGWNQFTVDQKLVANNPALPPTLRTAELQTTGLIVAGQLGIPDSTFIEAFKTFTPKERRLILCRYKNKHLFFDGEATYGSRQWSYFETLNGEIPHLFVESIDFGQEDPEGYIELLRNIFLSERTYVLDTPQNREKLPVNAHFVSRREFGELLHKADGYIVFHKAMSTRDEQFNPEEYLAKIWG